jgi:hypothetical protein
MIGVYSKSRCKIIIDINNKIKNEREYVYNKIKSSIIDKIGNSDSYNTTSIESYYNDNYPVIILYNNDTRDESREYHWRKFIREILDKLTVLVETEFKNGKAVTKQYLIRYNVEFDIVDSYCIESEHSGE